jgi:hypothetical protein
VGSQREVRRDEEVCVLSVSVSVKIKIHLCVKYHGKENDNLIFMCISVQSVCSCIFLCVQILSSISRGGVAEDYRA